MTDRNTFICGLPSPIAVRLRLTVARFFYENAARLSLAAAQIDRTGR